MGSRRREIDPAYAPLHAELRAILNYYDPVDLIRVGAPEDEYENELSTILPRLSEASDPSDVQHVLHEEFFRWFGEGITMFNYAEFEPVAADVWAAWVRFSKG